VEQAKKTLPQTFPPPGNVFSEQFIIPASHTPSMEDDAFCRTLSDLVPRRKEERWTVYDRWKASCTCPDCPSYNACARENSELLYCILGMSNSCIREDRHCTCPSCPLYGELGLSGKDFCMKGSEAAIRFERALRQGG